MSGVTDKKSSEKTEKKLAPEPDRLLTEREQVIAWNFIQLLDLNFAPQQAELILSVPGSSWHDADDLLKRGLSREQVVDQLT